MRSASRPQLALPAGNEVRQQHGAPRYRHPADNDSDGGGVACLVTRERDRCVAKSSRATSPPQSGVMVSVSDLLGTGGLPPIARGLPADLAADERWCDRPDGRAHHRSHLSLTGLTYQTAFRTRRTVPDWRARDPCQRGIVAAHSGRHADDRSQFRCLSGQPGIGAAGQVRTGWGAGRPRPGDRDWSRAAVAAIQDDDPSRSGSGYLP